MGGLSVNKRIFCGVFPCGISWSDRATERAGDYKPLAFLPFSTLVVEFQPDCPTELRAEIEADAASIQAKRGQQFEVSTCGQTVTLGRV
jgi:hypothetical protein